jgi:hypothetical protein
MMLKIPLGISQAVVGWPGRMPCAGCLIGQILRRRVLVHGRGPKGPGTCHRSFLATSPVALTGSSIHTFRSLGWRKASQACAGPRKVSAYLRSPLAKPPCVPLRIWHPMEAVLCLMTP